MKIKPKISLGMTVVFLFFTGYVYSMNSDLKIGGYVQTYYSDDTFDIRRTYLTLKGKTDGEAHYKLQADISASSDILRDAWLKLNISPLAKLILGQFKVPFSHEQLTSSSELQTIYRSGASGSLSYGRDIGVMFEGNVYNNKIYYAAAVVNGSGRNITDNNRKKDVVGRIVLSGIDKVLSIGGSFQTGIQPQDGTDKGLRARYGGLIIVKTDILNFSGEYIYQDMEQTDKSNRYSDGWYGMGTLKLLKQFQPVVKYERYDSDINASNNEEEIATLGCNLFFFSGTKLQANYLINIEPSGSNDEFLMQAQVKF